MKCSRKSNDRMKEDDDKYNDVVTKGMSWENEWSRHKEERKMANMCEWRRN